MKRDTFLVNLARGGVVDEAALMMKAGLTEVAQIHVANKADLDGADSAVMQSDIGRTGEPRSRSAARIRTRRRSCYWTPSCVSGSPTGKTSRAQAAIFAGNRFDTLRHLW